MALEKTWQYDMNRALSNVSTTSLMAKSYLWFIKMFLTGGFARQNQDGTVASDNSGLWTIMGSSDSAAAGMDGVDRWGTSFDSTKLVRSATGGGARSWICLKSPNALGPLYLIIDYQSSTGDSSFMVYMAWDLPTGGSTTAKPSATLITETVGTPTTTGRQFMEATTPAAWKSHGILATDGSFFILGSKDGSGLFSSAFVITKLAETKAADLYPQFMHVEYTAAGCLRSNLSTNSATPFGMAKRYSGANPTNGATTLRLSLSASDFFGLVGAVDNADSKVADWPIYVSPYNTTSDYSIKGRAPDWRLTHQSRTEGEVSPLSGTPERMIVGFSLVPTNQGPSL